MSASGAAALLEIVGSLDRLIHGLTQVTHSIFAARHVRYRSYAMVLTEVENCAATSMRMHSTSEVKWDPSNAGDMWGPTNLILGLPGIEAAAGGDNDAYYVQSAGFAALKKCALRVGQTDCVSLDSRDMYHYYQLHNPKARNPIDVGIHRYQTTSQLKQASMANQVLTVPMLLSTMRSKRPDRHFPLMRYYNQSVAFVLTMRNIGGADSFTYNRANLASAPDLKGQPGTKVASANISVRLFATFFLVDRADRHLDVITAPYNHLVHQCQTHEARDTLSAASQLAVQPIFNHPTSVIRLFYQPDSYTDGTMQSPNGVGRKNYFDYSGIDGGETLYNVGLKFNNSTIIDPNVPPALLRDQLWVERYHTAPYSCIYLIPMTNNLSSEDPQQTINLSAIDRFHIEANKNHAAPGTLFVKLDSFNMLSSESGFGGMLHAG